MARGLIGVTVMRLGVVPYLNCLPLVSGFPCEIYSAPPAQLATLAKPDDIILGPIVTAFSDPSWYLLEGVGIGSFGPVDTVRLFFNNKDITIQNINKIYLDNESSTSAALLKVLLTNCYQRLLAEIQFFTDRPDSAEGTLMIGDKVWEQDGNLTSLDLGKAWTDFTGLPFVYACWMTKNRGLAEEWRPKLICQAKNNLGHLEELAQNIPEEKRGKVLSYWRHLCYEMGPEQKKGIQLFQKYWSQI